MGKTIFNPPGSSVLKVCTPGKMDRSTFKLPDSQDLTYVHSYAVNFQHMVQELGVAAELEESLRSVFDQMNAVVLQMKQVASKEYDEIKGSGNPEAFLEYFTKGNQALEALKQIKRLVQSIGAAKTQVGDTHHSSLTKYTKNGKLLFMIPGHKGTTDPKQAAQWLGEHIHGDVSGEAEFLTREDCQNFADNTIQAVLDREQDNGFSTKRIGDTTNSEGKPLGPIIVSKFREFLKIWSTADPTYRDKDYERLYSINTFSQFLSTPHFHQSLGFLAEELIASVRPGGRVVGDDDNKATAADIQFALTGMDKTIIYLGESSKLWRKDILDDDVTIKISSLSTLLSQYDRAYRYMNYFLTNYFYLHPSGSEITKTKKVIMNFLSKLYFITLVFKGAAHHAGITQTDDAWSLTASKVPLPIILTINGKSMFTYKLWENLERLIKEKAIESVVHLSYDVGSDALALVQQSKDNAIRRARRKIPKGTKSSEILLTYDELLSDKDVQKAGRQAAVFNNRSASLGRVSTTIYAAKIMN